MQRRSCICLRNAAAMRFGIAIVILAVFGGFVAPVSAQDYEPDMDSYVGEAYEFSVEWDRNVWNSSSSVTFGDQESITVSNDVTTVSLNANPAGDQTVGECIDTAIADIESTPEYIDPTLVNDLEVPGPRSGNAGVTLVYGEMLEGRESPVEIGMYITCAEIADDGMLLIQVDTRLGIWGEELEIVVALLDTLETGL